MNGEVYEVGDELVCIKYYDAYGIPCETRIKVTSANTSGRYPTYTGEVIFAPHGRYRNGSTINHFGGSYFKKIGPTAPAVPIRTYDEMDKDELARHIVAVGKRVMYDATRRYGYCDEGRRTLDKFFEEAGLGAFVTVKKTVTIEVEVPANATEDAVREVAAGLVSTAQVRAAR